MHHKQPSPTRCALEALALPAEGMTQPTQHLPPEWEQCSPYTVLQFFNPQVRKPKPATENVLFI